MVAAETVLRINRECCDATFDGWIDGKGLKEGAARNVEEAEAEMVVNGTRLGDTVVCARLEIELNKTRNSDEKKYLIKML